MLLGINIKNVKQGETFRLKCDENAPLWVRDHYDRSSKKFCIHKYDDVNHFIMRKGTVTAYIEIESRDEN